MTDAVWRLARKLHTLSALLARLDLKQPEASRQASVGPLSALGIAGRHARLVGAVFAFERREDRGDIGVRRQIARGIRTNPARRIGPQPWRA